MLCPMADYETQARIALLRGEPLPPPPSPDDPAALVQKAKMTLSEVMDSHDAKASERVAAADSVLDRYAEPRKKFEMGGSRTVNIQLPPDAMAGALGALANLFPKPKGEIIDLENPVPPALPSRPLLGAGDDKGPDPH